MELSFARLRSSTQERDSERGYEIQDEGIEVRSVKTVDTLGLEPEVSTIACSMSQMHTQ